MNKTNILSLVLSLLLIFPTFESSAADGDFSVVAGGSINYKKLAFQIGEDTFKPQLVTFDLAFTAVYKSFYATLNYDKAIQDDYIYDYDAANQDDVIMTMSREDAGLTFGYSFANSLSVFGGYLDGTTTAIRPGNFSAIDFDPLAPPPGDETDRFNGTAELTMSGPFIGVGYAMPVGQQSTLSFNVAYADMGGEFNFDNGSSKDSHKGDTTGFSYGIGVSGPISDSLAYRIGIKITRYEFDDSDYIPGLSVPGNDDFTHDEDFSIFYVGVSNYF